jgi:flagellar motor switch protein FliN/FliY
MSAENLGSQADIDQILQKAGLGKGAGGGGGAGASQDEINALLGAEGGGIAPDPSGGGGIAPMGGAEAFRLESFAEAEPGEEGKLDLLMDVNLDVKIVLGRSQMAIEDIVRLKPGSVVELDKLAGDPLDVLVNNRLVARGEVLVLNDNFCIRITEILSPEGQIQVAGGPERR